MLGVNLAGDRFDHPQHPVTLINHHGDGGADQLVGHRVAGRAEPDAGQLVDLTADRFRADLQPQRRQLTQHLGLGGEPLGRDSVDFGMQRRVHLLTPRVRAHVESGDPVDPGVVVEFEWHQQVLFGIADQSFHDPLRLRIGRMAEIGPEPVMGREADIVRAGHHHVRHHTALQTPHPVGQHCLGNTTEDLEAFGEHAQRGRQLLVGGEPDEPEP